MGVGGNEMRRGQRVVALETIVEETEEDLLKEWLESLPVRVYRLECCLPVRVVFKNKRMN